MALDGSRPENKTQQPTKNTRERERMYWRGGLTGGERRGGAIRLFGGDQPGREGKKLKIIHHVY